MYALRRFAVRRSRQFEWVYQRLERPVAAVERVTKGLLFDCKMCGQCVLSSTGMSCPMNCPKQLRNGPCGGVRPGGFCEVKPDMRCVWVEAWDGASRMKHGDKIGVVLPPVDRRLEGSSAWLRASRERVQQLTEATEANRTALARTYPEARASAPTSAPLTEETRKEGAAR